MEQVDKYLVTDDKYASAFDVIRAAGVGQTAAHVWNEQKSFLCQSGNTSGSTSSEPLFRMLFVASKIVGSVEANMVPVIE